MKYERPKLVALSSMNVEGGNPNCSDGSAADSTCGTGYFPGGACSFGDAAPSGNCTDGNFASVCGVGALR